MSVATMGEMSSASAGVGELSAAQSRVGEMSLVQVRAGVGEMSLVQVRARVVERFGAVKARIEAAGGGDDVSVVAVTKAFGPWAIDAAAACGIDHIGESYAQECQAKLAQVTSANPPKVHFIGRLQRNKVKRLAGLVDIWQTIDRAKLAIEIGRRAPGATVMIQVNVTGAVGQGGCQPSEIEALASCVHEAGLNLVGLMTIGPQGTAQDSRICFRELRRMADEQQLPHCSMGMTDDLEAAIGEGATMVRIGRSLFGDRPTSS